MCYLVRVDLLGAVVVAAAFTFLGGLRPRQCPPLLSSLSAAIFLEVRIFFGTSVGSPSTNCRSLRLNFSSLSFPFIENFSAMVLRRGVE